ncbi:hypothetical protein M9H77_30323 [Catharanthus roseus]|uniref:Uncharacterized protein n=1 Tax=Catharanthus roseus TaxID=4058 RepID=A0ACB9ZXT7_CATRO|nr:hypothetical protein M9H77_30323 [Catharanthus roseus]
MKESCCYISSPLNSLPSEKVNFLTNSNNHFLACFSPSVQKFEAQNMENEGSLGYKLYKTIRLLHSTSFFSKHNSCVKPLNQSFGDTLVYSLTFKEILNELIFKRGFEVLHVLMINQDCSLKGGICIILSWTILS